MEPLAIATVNQVTTAASSGDAPGALMVVVPVVGIVLLGFVLPMAIARWWVGSER